MTETVSKDPSREGRQCKRDRQTRPTHRKGGGHAQDIARERQQGPPHKRTRTPPRRSEGWNGERLLRGLKLRNKRKIGVGPLKGKNQRERQELSQTRCRSEGHRKHSGSRRAQRESAGRDRSSPVQRYCQAQKTYCGQEEGQCRWPLKRTYGQGRTKARSENSRRHGTSARTTRKEGAGGCRALRGASDRGSNPIRKEPG